LKNKHRIIREANRRDLKKIIDKRKSSHSRNKTYKHEDFEEAIE